MIALLEQHRPAVAALCRKYGVRKLELFGSAARGDFDSADSDIDFFYEFDADPTALADRFFGLAEDLEKLLGRKVDLVMTCSPKPDPGDMRVPTALEGQETLDVRQTAFGGTDHRQAA